MDRGQPTRAACCSRCSATSATRTTSLLSGMAAAGDSAYAVVLDVGTWDRSGARQQTPPTAALRSGGWKATTLGRDGSLAAAWMELAR